MKRQGFDTPISGLKWHAPDTSRNFRYTPGFTFVPVLSTQVTDSGWVGSKDSGRACSKPVFWDHVGVSPLSLSIKADAFG